MKQLTMVFLGLLSFSSLVSVDAIAGQSNAEDPIRRESFASSTKVKPASPSAEHRSKVSSDGISIARKTLENKQRAKNTPHDSVKRTLGGGEVRDASKPTSANAGDFDIYDAWVDLDYDADGDGYYSELTVNLDADHIGGGYADVFADIWISFEGGDWFLLTTTDVFTIYGAESGDDYHVSLVLNNGFQPGSYDLLIDLYEAGFSGVVATLGPEDDADLFDLPLEDVLEESLTAITYMATELSGDEDRDGFYTQVTLEYDIDTVESGRVVYASVQIIDAQGRLEATISTNDFTLGNQTEVIDILLDAGYSADWYDLDVALVDSYTGEVITGSAGLFDSLLGLPLESYEYDEREVEVVVVHESGGGSTGWILLLSLLCFSVIQRKQLQRI